MFPLEAWNLNWYCNLSIHVFGCTANWQAVMKRKRWLNYIPREVPAHDTEPSRSESH